MVLLEHYHIQNFYWGMSSALPTFSCTALYFNGTLDGFIKSQKIHTLEQKSSHYELIEVQKGLQCTCQAKMIIGNSITPSVALLVHITPYWTVMNLQGHIYVC